MSIDEAKGLRTWIEVDRSAIEKNYKAFRQITFYNVKLCGVVKSNAYGHGIVDFSRELASQGIDWLAVDSIVEALRLREEGISLPVLVLGYTLPERLKDAVQNDISISVSTFEIMERIVEDKDLNNIKVHIKVDTGMLRQGFRLAQKDRLVSFLSSNDRRFILEGLFTHFASAKNKAFPEDTLNQLREFKEWIAELKSLGFNPLVHASATAGTLLYKEAHFDMCRIGIGMYGLWPSTQAKHALEGNLSLAPTLSWKTVISEIKDASKGEKVGYDLTETLERDSKLAVCPIGYWHGFPRKLSGIGHVLVGGKRCKVMGRISMDMITIDVTDASAVSAGDEVVLIGKQSGEEITVYDIADLDETSWYETVTQINPLIKRLYL